MQCNVRGFVHCLFTVFVLIEEISVACQHNKSDIPSSTRGAGSWKARGTMAPPNFVDIEKRTEVEIEINNLLVVPPTLRQGRLKPVTGVASIKNVKCSKHNLNTK